MKQKFLSRAWQVISALSLCALLSACGSGSASTPQTAVTPQPMASASPGALMFGNEPVGATSAAQPITVMNTGTATLVITAVTVTPSEFQLQSGPAAPVSLNPGASATYMVDFVPDLVQSFAGQFTLTSNAAPPAPVMLSGTGTGGVVGASSASLTFPGQPVGTTSAAMPVTLSNTGNAPLTLNSVTPTGQFAVNGFPGVTTLNPGQQLGLSVTFSPTAAGSAAGALTVLSTAVNSPTSVTLTGTGLQAAISLTPGTLTFANQSVGTTSAAQSVVVMNTGNTTLNITAISISPVEFVLQSGPSAPVSLSPGLTATFTVAFSPDSATTFNGQLTFTSNAATPMVSATLTGTGTSNPAVVNVSPLSLTFPDQVQGTISAPQTVTVSNGGSVNFTVTAVVAAAPFAVSGFSGATTLTPNQQLVLSVTFAPTTPGSFSGTLSISYDTLPSNSVSLSGTATASTAGTLAVVSPASVGFGSQVVGSMSPATPITVINAGTTAFTVNSVSTVAPFAVTGFSGAVPLNPGQQLALSVTFAPTSAVVSSGTLTIATTASATNLTVNLSGTGVGSAAVVSVTPASLDFGNQTVGTSSPLTTVTITNTGTNSLILTGFGVGALFAATGFPGTTTLAAGQALALSVSFSPTTAGLITAQLAVYFSSTSASLVSLSGTGTAVAALTITTTSPLPAATQNASYFAALSASGGVPPYSWALAPGSALPSGLLLAGAGTISGSANSASTGEFPFLIQVTDSNSPPATASTTLTLAVGAPTGANCNQISSGSPPFVPLNDLGTGTFQNEEGGLYPNGSNSDPSAHLTSGENLAAGIQPRDADGTIDAANGKIVLLSIGMSNAKGEFNQFINDATADTTLNSHLVIVNGAQSGFGAGKVADPNSVYWTNIETLLANAGVADKQVAVAWVKEADAGPNPNESFLNYATTLQGQLEVITQILQSTYANIKLAYFSARIYGGYASTSENPEPFAYYSGFSDKWAIQDQINGSCSLNFDPTQCGGTVLAPWMAWGPYWWANGMTPRSDGQVWTCQDLASDGTHPSNAGEQKAANLLLTFFKTDPTATPWFLAPP